MAPRDRWIGWGDATRQRNLVRVVCNSRFLILPWVRVKNLASATLAQALRALEKDWQEAYGVTPLLVETFVDERRFALRPMNCPGACLVFGSTRHSYRDLPLRLAERLVRQRAHLVFIDGAEAQELVAAAIIERDVEGH